MAEYIATLDSLDELFADFIQAVLNLSSDQVKIAYPVRGQKAPAYNETVVYVHTSQVPDESIEYKSRSYKQNPDTGAFTTEQDSMRRLSLDISFYGANCDTLAIKFKELLYFESSKEFLYRNNLSLIPSRIGINNKVHEKFNERWWERVDMNIGFYNKVAVEELNNPFEIAVIGVASDKGIVISV